jgi:hypothetical protein
LSCKSVNDCKPLLACSITIGAQAAGDSHQRQSERRTMLQRFLIEREIPKIGTFDSRKFREAAIKSNEVLRQLGTDIQWVESYVSDDRLFCVYLATSEELIRKHSQMSGFPANRITAIKRMIDPTTAHSSVGPVPLGHVL